MFVKAFRLFVSSTFADFAQERELLQSKVFPALDAYCAAKGYEFHPIDLRWGVNEEAQLDQRTAEICLGEARAAKGYPPPNFLIMIGNRYGWIPLPYAIARDEFEAAVAQLDGCAQQDTARALGTLYDRDDNYLVPRGLSVAQLDSSPLISAYTLRSRADEPDLKSAETWARIETQLRRAMQEAANDLLKLGRIDAASHEKYFRSLTEQEIDLGLRGHSPTRESATSFLPPMLGTDDPQTIAFFREITGNASAPPGLVSHYVEEEPRLDALKDRIKRAVPEASIVTAGTTWQASGTLDPTYLVAFADQIQRKLEAAINRHIARIEAVERAADFALERERAEHRAFGEQKSKIFIGRENNLAAIAGYIAGRDDHALILHGRSGLGKSAVMARAIAAAEAAGDAPVIYRFIGASAASSDIRLLLISVVDDLAARDIVERPEEFEQDANKFSNQIKALLSSITKPIVIFLDALDQLRKPQHLGWLPARLPAVVKIVISVLDDEAYRADSGTYRSLRQYLVPDAFLEIEPLGTTDGHDILTALERDARRRLQGGQRDYVIGQFEKAGASPLWLRTAFEVARGWRSTDRPGEGCHVLAGDAIALIAQFIGDLSAVHHHEPELVSHVLGYLAAAKDGLSAKELTEVLSRDPDVMNAISTERHGARTAKLPPSVWARLNRQLAPFLIEKYIDDQPLLQFFHREVAHVAREQHYEPAKGKLHAALASYFESRASRQEGGAEYEKRSLSELPYQLHLAENTSRLGEILMSSHWMQQKLAALGPRRLIDDYQFARTGAHKLTGRTLQLVVGILARDKGQLLPQLIGRLTASTDAVMMRFLQDARVNIEPPAIIPQRQSLTGPGAETARLEGHEKDVTALAVLPDGRLASGSQDNTIRLWDVQQGVEVMRLAGHESEVAALAVLPDGRLASGSQDNTIRLWDVQQGVEVMRLAGHENEVTALAVLPDGRLASAAWDSTIRLWDVTSGRESARLAAGRGRIHAFAVLPDGRLACLRWDLTSGYIQLWDTKRGIQEALLAVGHDGRVHAIAVLPDGRLSEPTPPVTPLAVSPSALAEPPQVTAFAVMPGGRVALFSRTPIPQRGSYTYRPDGTTAFEREDRAISLWDVKGGFEITRLQVDTNVPSPHPHETMRMRGFVAKHDGRLASASDDGTIRLWEVGSGRESARLVGHVRPVRAFAVLPDGSLVSASDDATIRVWDVNGADTRLERDGVPITALAVVSEGLVASGYLDGTIRLWDPRTGQETSRCEGHELSIAALTALPHGRLASASSDATIRLWDVKTGACAARFDGQTGLFRRDRTDLRQQGFTALALLPNGRLAAAFKGKITIRLWSLKTGTETTAIERGVGFARLNLFDTKIGAERSLEVHNEPVDTLAVLPDGRLLSVSGLRVGLVFDAPSPFFAEPGLRTIRLWDVRSGTEITHFEIDCRGVIVLPDGRVASFDRTIQLWDLTSGTAVARFEGHGEPLTALAALPDGRLVSGSEDKTLRLWDVERGVEITRLELDASVDCLAVLPDGRIVAGDALGRLHWLEVVG